MTVAVFVTPDLPFIVKARHSVFYGTQPEMMRRNMRAHTPSCREALDIALTADAPR
jgi:hypothetical protein